MKNTFHRSLARAALLVLTTLGLSAAAFAQVSLSVTVAPPVLPVYAQPMAPGPGYIWSPGYWAWGITGYYWVPGTWVIPPAIGVLWTPGYWGWRNGFYAWNAGYWGPRVGFYGGINYGFGYVGVGYAGGYWNNGAFYYNRAVNNVNVTNIHTTYNTVVTNTTVNRVSYNGGTGGVRAEPTAVERGAMNEHHVEPTELQLQHEHAAASNRALLASVNHGRPAIAATPQAGAFDHPGVVAARGNPAHKVTTASGNTSIAHGTDMPKQVKAQPQKSEGQPHPQGHPQGAAAAAHPQGQHNSGEPHVEEHRHKEG